MILILFLLSHFAESRDCQGAAECRLFACSSISDLSGVAVVGCGSISNGRVTATLVEGGHQECILSGQGDYFDCGSLGKTTPIAAAPQNSPNSLVRGRNGTQSGTSVQPTGAKGEGTNKNGEKKESAASPFPPPKDTSAFGQQSPGQCPFNRGTPMRSDYDRVLKACDRAYRRAIQICDANKDKGLIKALQSAKNAQKKIAQSKGVSGVSACDEYQKMSSNLKSALKKYQETCRPVQKKCEQNCNYVTPRGDTINQEVAGNLWCQRPRQVASRVGKDSRRAVAQESQCVVYRGQLTQAENDAKALINPEFVARVCQKKWATICRENPKHETCARLKSVSQFESGASMGERGSTAKSGSRGAVKAPFEDEFSGISQQNDGSSTSEYGNTSFAGSADFGEIQYAEQADGIAGQKGARTKRQHGSAAKGSSSRGAGAGYRRKKYNFGQYTLDPITGKKIKKTNAQLKTGKELKKYLPGGKSDPSAFNHGITGPAGPTLFEKVYIRYRFHNKGFYQETED